ncbi:MAG: L-dopachrome tautomerase-related protein [Woeseiaceae bacterium]
MARVFFGFIVFFLLLALGVWLKFGGGHRFSDVNTDPVFEADVLEPVFAYDQPIGDIAIAADGTLFFSVHPAARTDDNQVLRIEDGIALPFPDGATQQQVFGSVSAISTDALGRLWVVDHGNFGFANPQLLAFDQTTGERVFALTFDSALAPRGSMLQEIVVTADGNYVFIADTSLWRETPALLLVNVADESAERILNDHPAFVSQQWQLESDSGNLTLMGGLLSIMPGIDALSISPDNRWLYQASMSHDGLFRTSLDRLGRAPLKPERYSDKPLTDALAVAAGGNVYVTDPEHGSVLQIDGRRRITTLVQSSKLRWPSALALGPDDFLYVGDSALPLVIMKDASEVDATAPYRIFRFRP